MNPALGVTPLSEFSATLWSKRELTEQNILDLDALDRSLLAIELLALPSTIMLPLG